MAAEANGPPAGLATSGTIVVPPTPLPQECDRHCQAAARHRSNACGHAVDRPIIPATRSPLVPGKAIHPSTMRRWRPARGSRPDDFRRICPLHGDFIIRPCGAVFAVIDVHRRRCDRITAPVSLCQRFRATRPVARAALEHGETGGQNRDGRDGAETSFPVGGPRPPRR